MVSVSFADEDPDEAATSDRAYRKTMKKKRGEVEGKRKEDRKKHGD